MSEPPNLGDTLSGGIQEVSALLPLLGTEQCERHVGTALEKGWLFAAATPLSIFGSLGIVKTAFATLLATTTRPFYGGRWLSDTGLETTGSVSSMVTLVKDTKLYGAEVQLQRLMKEQHINDPELVQGIEWPGWRRSNRTGGPDNSSTDGTGSVKSSAFPDIPWNASLILSSMILSLIGITPYLYLIHNHWGRVILWLFPILRSFGSMLCVVSVQLALQMRIHRIITASLLLMKARKWHPLKIDEAVRDRDTLLELRLHNLREELRRLSDPEKQSDKEHFVELQNMLKPHSSSDNVFMLLLQATLVLGMATLVAGYVGCFNMVSRTDVPNGPYVWLGMETGLAVLRIALWGWNPSWDEGNTGMTMHLALRSKNLTPHTPSGFLDSDSSKANSRVPIYSGTSPETNGAVQLPSTPALSFFPLITTSQRLSRLTSPIEYAGLYAKENKETFIAEPADDFLAAATAYVGPLPRLNEEELEGISLYYGIVPDISESCERKLLCMTVGRSDSKWTSISVFINGDYNSHTAFTSRSRDFPGTRALRVGLDTKVELHSIAVIDRRTLNLLLDYSFRLFSRLCTGDTSSGRQLALSWNVTLPSSLRPGTIRQLIPLTKPDKRYLRMRQICDLKSDYCLQRGALVLGVFRTNEDREWGLMLESAVMEVYLCILEHRFVRPISPSPGHLRPLELEWIRGMEDRISLERDSRHMTWRDARLKATRLFEYEGTYDMLVRELRSLRQLHSDSHIIQRWGEIMDHLDSQSPSISDLFALPPFHNLERLRKALFPLFTVNSQADVPSPVYHKMITHLRSSLSRLSHVKASSLYDRIDPYGPGSPEFSPPYTEIRQVSDATSNALSLQFESVQMLEIRPWGCHLLDVLHMIKSLSPSLSLASVTVSTQEMLDNEALQLMISILQRHHKIVCILFDRCGTVDKTHIDHAIATNRRKWKEDTQNGGRFDYIVGCDQNATNYSKDHLALSVYQRDICLTNHVDVFAMIHIPRPGRITLNFSAKSGQQCVVNLIATLTRSVPGSVGAGAMSNDVHTIPFDVDSDPDSLEFKTVSVQGFPELRAGCYELRIQNSSYFLFRKLTIEFTARPASKESGGKLNSGSKAAEGVRKVQEGEEGNGGEQSSQEQVKCSLELHPGTQSKELGDYLGLSRCSACY
ncbi:hypothetical protein PM082_021967 [Marasmius tenuissimus]|nr:hypothetical protein PM082_021967 [Marasmius tenuissimus]